MKQDLIVQIDCIVCFVLAVIFIWAVRKWGMDK